ncbi:MAG TPA: sulfurtransferase [Brevibacterium senegalense]|uniref:Sulfurtransferase n=1 Tax=Brevibacterium senegalense TaxID=1033736 RepID=A0A921MCM1_9MICO|nr:sulfurtransferase [Brevibacterium senegalense]
MTEQGAAGARDARSRVILTVEELRALLETHGLLGGAGGSAPASSPLAPIVLDVRWTLPKPDGRDDFEAGHIPGARYVALDTELADHANTDPTRGRHPLPTVDQFEQTVREWRVTAQTPVVVYDDVAGQGAARAWWMLRWVGHEDVRVLDGGWTAWKGAGLPVEAGAGAGAASGDDAEAVVTSAQPFTAQPGGMPVLSADDAARLAQSGVLLDARAPERYDGSTEPLDPVAGHIPGAHNAPAGGTTDGVRFRSPDELREYYRGVGAVPAADGEDATAGAPASAETTIAAAPTVGAYCGSGVSASHTVLTLASLGIDAALFPGSWSAWSNDPARPVATGTAEAEQVHPPRG